MKGKEKTNHIKIVILLSIAFFMLLFKFFTISISYNQPIKAAYAANVITDGADFWSTFYSNGNNISGNYSLQNDITLDYSSLPNDEYIKKSFSGGTFDGNGKKITITGSKTLQYYANANLDTVQDLDIGLLFGNLLNYKVQNLKVLFDANIHIRYENPSAYIPDERADDMKISSAYVGILSGKSSGSSSMSDVDIETTASSRLFVEGIDNKSGFSDREKAGWGYKDWQSPIDRAVSATVALVVGRSNNFTSNQISIKHNGLIISQSHCKIAGQSYVYQSSGGGPSKQYTHSSDYGSHAALFVGMADINSTTNLNYISIEGTGAVVTLLKAASNSTTYIFNDCAGVVSGKILSGITAFNVKGLLYNYNGRVVAATGVGNTIKARLIIGGGVDAKTSIKYFFRDQTVNNGKVASYNQINVTPPASVGGVTSSNQMSSINKTLSFAATDNLGFSGSIASTTTNIESLIPVHEGNTKNDALLTSAIVKYKGFEKVTDTERKIRIFVDLQTANRYLSALEYKASANDTQYISVYANKVTSFEFTLNLNYAQLERVYTYIEQVYINGVDFKIGTNTYSGSHSFQYNGQTSNFSASLETQGIVFGSNLRWSMSHTPRSGYDAEPSNSNQASLTLSVPKTAGTYNFSLKKDVNGVLQNLADGDVIAGNSDTHPSNVYTYSSAYVSNFEFTLTINPIEVTLSSGSGTLSKAYDGTTALGAALVRGLHYDVTGIIPSDASEVGLEYTSASFADSSVGSNKTITISGITFNLPNYTTPTTEMTFNSGQITKKKIEFEYTYDPNAQLGMDGAYRYGYIGTKIIPGVEPVGVVSGEQVSFISRIYLSNSPSDTTVVDAIDVGTYYFRLSLSGGHQGNYEIRDFEATLTGKPFYIIAKQIDIVWEVDGVDIGTPEYTPLIYNGSDQSEAVTTSSDSIYARDTLSGREIVWTYVIKNAVTNDIVDFIDSGAYNIEADLIVTDGTKNFKNYTIKSSTSLAQLTIEKFAFSLQYHYNDASFSTLTYNATNLKVPIKAVQPAGEEPRLPRIELAKVVLDYYLVQSDESLVKIDSATPLKNVGNYKIKPTYSNLNSNFIINSLASEFSFTVEPKIARINIPQREFIYRAANIKGLISYETQDIEVSDRQSVFITIEIPLHPEIINVGEYAGTVKISSQNYIPEVWENGVSTYDDDVNIEVTPYDLSITYPPSYLMPTIEVSNIPQYEFTGEDIEPNVFVQLKNGSDLISTLDKDVDYYLEYSDNISVGQATVIINGKGNYKNTKNVNFQITKINLIFTYIGYSQYTYDSTDLKDNITFNLEKSLSGPQAATVILTYYYKGEGQHGYTVTDNVIDSGSYYVRNSLDPDNSNNENYNLNSTDFNFTVVKKNVRVSFSNYTNLIFDGESKSVNCNFLDENQLGENDKDDEDKVKITISYTKLTKQGELVPPENLTNAGSYYARANLVGTKSHNYLLVTETIYQDFFISKLVVNPNFTIDTEDGIIIYDTLDKKNQIMIDNSSDNIPEIDASQISSWYIRQYRREIASGVYSEVLANVRNAGTYRLEVSLPTSSSQRASNYTVAVNSRFFTFTIAKATITAIFTKDNIGLGEGEDSWEYVAEELDIGTKFDITGDSQAPGAQAMKAELALIQLSPNFYIIDCEEEISVENPINAGQYVAKLENLEGTLNNYIIDDNIDTEFFFEITQKTISSVAWGQGVNNGPYTATVREIVPNSSDVIESDYIFSVTAHKRINPSTEVEIEMSDIKDSGQYRVNLTIISSNYKFATGVETEKIFTINKLSIQYVPPTREVIQEFGSQDIPYSYVHRVAFGGSIFEDITISLTRMPGNDVRQENNGIYPYQTATSTNNNYEIILSNNNNEYGVRIVKYKHTVNPKSFSKYYDGSSTPPELKEGIIINLENPMIGTIEFSLVYKVPLGATDAGYYNLEDFDWEEVEGGEHPHKKNIEIIIDTRNMENKYQIHTKGIEISVPEGGIIEFTYGTEVYKSDLYAYMEITNPMEVGDEHANTKKGQYFDINLKDFPNMDDLEGGFINFNEDGYLLNITMKSTNYNSVHSPVRIYITRREIPKYDINLSLNKIYDGTDQVVVPDNVWKTPELIDPVAISRGLSVRARFANKDVGDNKNIYVEYFVDSRYVNNFDLQEEYTLEGEFGEISPREIDIAFNVMERQVIYGNDFNLNIQEIHLVGGETLESQHITINLYANIEGQIVALNDIRDVGVYDIKVEVDNPDTNYTFENADTTARLIIQQRNIGIQPNSEYTKYEDGTVDVDISVGNYYKFTNVLEEDNDKLFITGYSAELISASHQYLPNYIQVRNIQLASSEDALINNYVLSIADVLNIPARVLPIFSNLILTPRDANFDNTPKEVEYRVSLVEGAEIHLRYAGLDSVPVNAGTYIVTSFVKRGNYEVEGPETTLTIKKATPNIEFFGEFRQIYGDFTPIQAKATSPYGLNVTANITYSFDSQNFNYEPAGENHIVFANFEENTNYNAVTMQRKLVIKPKEVTITFSNYDNIVYNGQDQKENIGVTVNGAMEADLFKPHKVFSSSEVKHAGEYSVSVSSKNPNYVISGVSSLNFRVKKANLTVRVVIDDTVMSKKPTYKIIYEGFIEGDEIKDLEKEPIVIISQSKMGENTAIPQGGLDANYNFVFENEEASYNVVGNTPTNTKSTYLPYLIIGGIFGLTVLVLVLAFISRKKILRKAVSRRKGTR